MSNKVSRPQVITSTIILSIFSNIGLANSLCDIALESGAFNTSDYSSSTNLITKMKDAVCKSEYNSKSEAISSAKKSGGNIGYGGFTLGASDAKQNKSGKWSLSKSAFCKASASELKNASSYRAQKQVADKALNAWESCVNTTQTNKLFVKYSLNIDGTGMTGKIIRGVINGGFGKITGLMRSDPDVELNCTIGTTKLDLGSPISIQIDRSSIGMRCKKNKKDRVKIALVTDQGDQDWIDLPPVDTKPVPPPGNNCLHFFKPGPYQITYVNLVDQIDKPPSNGLVQTIRLTVTDVLNHEAFVRWDKGTSKISLIGSGLTGYLSYATDNYIRVAGVCDSSTNAKGLMVEDRGQAYSFQLSRVHN